MENNNKIRLYQELEHLLEEAIRKMKKEYPQYEIFTASIQINKKQRIAIINFDSVKHIKEVNQKEIERLDHLYHKYKEIGEIETAHKYEFNPNYFREYNPSQFDLYDLYEVKLESSLEDWHDILVIFGKYAYHIINQELNINRDYFELGINSNHDYYDECWHR